MKPAAESLIQVTQAMQRRQDYMVANGLQPQQNVDPSVVQAGGQQLPGQGQPGQVQQVGAQQAAAPGAEPRRLIEVYTGGPRRYTPPAQNNTPAAAPAMPGTMPTGSFAPGFTPPAMPQAAPATMPQSPGGPAAAAPGAPTTQGSFPGYGGMQQTAPTATAPTATAALPNMSLPGYLQPQFSAAGQGQTGGPTN
ncbi:MAG: hypothetical protein QM775_28050 [Pirellulales bacterium]